MGKIAFVRMSHRDYISDVSISKGNEAADTLKKTNIDIICNSEPIVDPVEARDYGYKICSENVDAVIIFFETWVEPSVVMAFLLEVKHLPVALWGIPMFEHNGKLESTGSFVGLTAFSGSLKRLRIKHEYIYGLPGEDKTLIDIRNFLNASSTIKRLRATRLGLVGYSAMSIYPGTFDHLLLRGIIGPEVIQLDTYSLINIADKAEKSQYIEFLEKVKKKAKISNDLTDEILEKEGRLYFAINQLVKKHNLDSINIKCQYELSQEYGCIPCPALSLIAEEGIVAGCEGDILTTVSQVILKYLSNQTITYGDILDVKNGEALFSSCGFAPYSLAQDSEKVEIRDINTPGFSGPISSMILKKGKITYMRVNEDQDGFVMNFGTGEGLDTELRQGRFPALKFKINGNEKDFIKSLYCQHYAICYGDYIAELTGLCNFMNIKFNLID